MHKMKRGLSAAAIIVIILAFVLIMVVFTAGSIFKTESVTRRYASEATLISESDKLETYLRSFMGAIDLSLVQSVYDSGTDFIILPYDFDSLYLDKYKMPYWQIYDQKYIPPTIIMLNKMKQEISWISSSYINDYRNAFEDFSNKRDTGISFSPSSIAQVSTITSINIQIIGGEMKFVMNRLINDQKLNIERTFRPYSRINTRFLRTVSIAEIMIDNDWIGRCIRNETMPAPFTPNLCYHNKLDKTATQTALNNLAQSINSIWSLGVNLQIPSLDDDFFNDGVSQAAADVSVYIYDYGMSYTLFSFPSNKTELSYIGVRFLAKAGDKISNAITTPAKNLPDFHDCSEVGFPRVGIISQNSQICNFFRISSGTCSDSDSGVDENTAGTCTDFTGVYSDACVGNAVYEYYCHPSNVCHYQRVDCPISCSSGACS